MPNYRSPLVSDPAPTSGTPHGGQDPVVPVSDARFVAAALPRAELAVFPGDLHDVLNEHDRDAVHDVVVRFLDRVQVREPIS